MLNDSDPTEQPSSGDAPDSPASQPSPQQPAVSEPRRHPLERVPQQPSPPPETGGPAPSTKRINLRIQTVRPTLTYILIGINIAVFVLRLVSLEIDRSLVAWGANNPVAVLQDGEFYRLFTSMFLHASAFNSAGQFVAQNMLHLLFNMLALYSIGTEVERFFGHVRFALIYILGGLTGSVFSAILSDPQVFSIGASGAVFAILGAEMVFLYRHRRLFGEMGRQRLQNTVILLAINLIFGLLSTVNGAAMRIDNFAHIGGAVGGAALTWFIGPFFNLRRHPEHPNELQAEDINPLRGRYGAVSLYFCALLIALIIARLTLNG